MIDLSPGVTASSIIADYGEIDGVRKLTDLELGTVKLRKYGNVTKKTEGIFTGISPSNGCFYFGETTLGKHFYPNLIQITGTGQFFSDGGDSGSFIIDENRMVVGIIVMGERNVSFGIPAHRIEEKLKITFANHLKL